MNMAKLAFKRVLLKVSGEILMGPQPFGIDLGTVERVASEIAETLKTGVQLSLVIGGGNIFRGMAQAAKGMDRVSADHPEAPSLPDDVIRNTSEKYIQAFQLQTGLDLE